MSKFITCILMITMSRLPDISTEYARAMQPDQSDQFILSFFQFVADSADTEYSSKRTHLLPFTQAMRPTSFIRDVKEWRGDSIPLFHRHVTNQPTNRHPNPKDSLVASNVTIFTPDLNRNMADGNMACIDRGRLETGFKRNALPGSGQPPNMSGTR